MRLARLPGATICLAVALAGMVLSAPAAADKSELDHQLKVMADRTAFAGFSLPDLNGRTHTPDELRGKVAILNFWAVWCPPCREEMPSLERLRKRLADKPLVVVAIAQGETSESVRAYLGTLKPAPNFLNLLDADWSTTTAYGVRGLPTSFILDKHGRIAFQALGGREFDHPNVIKDIEKLLAE